MSAFISVKIDIKYVITSENEGDGEDEIDMIKCLLFVSCTALENSWTE